MGLQVHVEVKLFFCGMKSRHALICTILFFVAFLAANSSFANNNRKVVALFTGFSGSSGGTGIEDLDSQLQSVFGSDPAVPFSSRVFGYSDQTSAFNFISSFSDTRDLIIIGHSLGGDAVIELTKDYLLPVNKFVDLTIQIDSVGVGDELIPGNVIKAFNYYQISTGLLEPQGATNVVGATNINVESLFSDNTITHTSIDDDQRLQDLIVSEIQTIQMGTTEQNPLLPWAPDANQPWQFPSIYVTNPAFVWWLDPEVAIGYIYSVTNPVGPLFDQFIPPDLPLNTTYDLYGSASACTNNPGDYTVYLDTIQESLPYNFSSALPCFAVKGIDELNNLDPLNTLAFKAGISFDKIGPVNVTQTPIQTPMPAPILGAGLVLKFSRKIKKRILLSSIN